MTEAGHTGAWLRIMIAEPWQFEIEFGSGMLAARMVRVDDAASGATVVGRLEPPIGFRGQTFRFATCQVRQVGMRVGEDALRSRLAVDAVLTETVDAGAEEAGAFRFTGTVQVVAGPHLTELDHADQLRHALSNEARPFLAIAGLPIGAAHLAEHSVWPQGERRDRTRAFRSIVLRYGDEARWAMAGVRFGEFPRDDPTDAHREAGVRSDMAFELGLRAAEPGDGEASWNRDGMLERIRVAQVDAAATMAAGTFVVDGESVSGYTATVGEHRRWYRYLPVGGAVFVHTCRWDAPVELRRSLDYAAIRTDAPR
ncbi:MAG: hypothetical protein AAGC46_20225 [Solirubrobacteraceae bacterium]|nr:hypothetical protein [Patulibacter sp.]